MEDSAFSDEFCRFLQTSVPSVTAAELLLSLAEQPEQWCIVKDLVAKLPVGGNFTEGEAWTYLQLQARDLVAIGPDKRVQYRPASAGRDALVRTLAQAYNERPVTLIRVIYALRDSRIQSFADAFRIRKA